MGKIKIKTLGLENIEKEEKQAAKRRREQKQLRKAAVDGPQPEVEEEVKEVTTASDKETITKKETEVKKSKKQKKVKIHGKKYLDAKKVINQNKKYSLKDAVSAIQSFPKRSFDESVELHLGVADSGIKGDVNLPHGTGKAMRVVVADDAILSKLEEGGIDFDILLSTPAFMPKLVKFAKLLGPKGLMPNPKQGTVTEKTDEAIKKFSQGLLYFKTEPKFPLMHLSIGKKSFKADQLIENIQAIIASLGKPKVRTAHISSTMSPSVEVDINSL